MTPRRRKAWLIFVVLGLWVAVSTYHYLFSPNGGMARGDPDLAVVNAIGAGFAELCVGFVLLVVVLSLLGRFEHWLRGRNRDRNVPRA